MTERLDKARRKGLYELEDFVGTFVLDRFTHVRFHAEQASSMGAIRTFQLPGTRLRLDGRDYDFVSGSPESWRHGDESRLRWITHCDSNVVALLGRDDTREYEGPFVVTIGTYWDVARRSSKWAAQDRILEYDAQRIYGMCDNIEGRVLFELGNEIHVEHADDWRVRYLSKWYPEGIIPSYLEGRDPDEPKPTEIIKAIKPYTPKVGGGATNKRGRLRG